MNENKMYELIDKAVEFFRTKGYEVDDIRWNIESGEFAMEVYDWKNVKLKKNPSLEDIRKAVAKAYVGCFHFEYNDADWDERTPDVQLIDALGDCDYHFGW